MSLELIDLCKQLIQFRGITPNDGGCIEFLKTTLSDLGFSDFCEKGFFGEQNLYCKIGSGRKNFCFAGHVDVVPAGDESQWTHDPFMGIVQDDVLYGRGAVDMKSEIAAFICAAQDFKTEHPNFDGIISILITTDEEGAGLGTKNMLKHITSQGEKIDYCIVGEPSSNERVGDSIRIGRRGSVNCIIKFIGKQGHAAYPHNAKNPLTILIKSMNHILNHEWGIEDERFLPTNLEMTSIDTDNEFANVIPNSTICKFNIRFNYSCRDINWKDFILKKIHEQKNVDISNYDIDIITHINAESFITDNQEWIDVISDSILDVTGYTPHPNTHGGTSDARFVKNYCPVVDCGILNRTAHQINEHSSISDICTIYSIYKTVLKKIFIC